MCLYRQIPLSPEWYVGTKIAHKTERQGYLPFDFLSLRIPSPQIEFIDRIRLGTNISLSYELDFLTEALREAISPLNDLPRNFSRVGNSVPDSVDVSLE
jgi:hypothetical protein